MEGLFLLYPLLKTPESSEDMTSDIVWRVFSRNINRVLSAGYLHEKEIIDKNRPGHEDYTTNQFIYVRHVYSVALDYLKRYLKNVLSTEQGKPYSDLHRRKLRIRESFLKKTKEKTPIDLASTKTEPVSQKTASQVKPKFIQVSVTKYRSRQINGLVRQIIKHTVLMLNYWHIDNYEHEYALLEDTFLDFITFFFDFLDTVNQEMVLWWTEQIGKNFSYIAEDFRKGSHSLFKDAFKTHWWFLECEEGDIDQLEDQKLKFRPSKFTKRKEHRFRVPRSRAPVTRKRDKDSTIHSYHTTQSQVRADCFLQEHNKINDDREPLLVFSFQAERVCKVLLRLLARTRFLWDKNQKIEKIRLVHSVGKLFDHSKATAAYLLDLPESDLVDIGRLILCAEKIPQTNYAKESVFCFFRHALACIQTYTEEQKLKILGKALGTDEEKIAAKLEKMNVDIKEENKENIEQEIISCGIGKKTKINSEHTEFMSQKFSEEKPYFNGTIEILFDVIKLARERLSPQLPLPVFSILDHFEKDLFYRENRKASVKASPEDIYTWFRILTDILVSKFKNADTLVSVAIKSLLFGVTTRSLENSTYLVYTNACFSFIRQNGLFKPALEKIINVVSKLSHKITPDPSKASTLANALVNLAVPNDLNDLHFTACGNLMNYFLLYADKMNEENSLKESVFLVFTQLRGYRSLAKSEKMKEAFKAAEKALAEKEFADDLSDLIRTCRRLLVEQSPLFPLAVQKLCNYLLHRKDPATFSINKFKFLRAFMSETFHDPATRRFSLLLVEVICGDFCDSNNVIQIELPFKFKDATERSLVVSCKTLPASPSERDFETITTLFENVFDGLVTSYIRLPWTKEDLIVLERFLQKFYVLMAGYDSRKHSPVSHTIMKMLFIPFTEKKCLTDPRLWRLLRHFPWRDVDEHLRSINSTFMESFLSLDCSMWKEVVSIACCVDQPPNNRTYARQVLLKLLPIASKSGFEDELEKYVVTNFENVQPNHDVALQQLIAETGCQKILAKFPFLVKTTESEILDVVSKTLLHYARKDMELKELWKMARQANQEPIPLRRRSCIPPMGSYTGMFLSTMCNILGYSRPKDLFMPMSSFLGCVDDGPGYTHPYVMLIGSGILYNMPRDELYMQVDDIFASLDKPKGRRKERLFMKESSRNTLKKLGPEWTRKSVQSNVLGPQLIAKLLLILHSGKDKPEVVYPLKKIFTLLNLPWYTERRPIEPRRGLRRYESSFESLSQNMKFTFVHLCAESDLKYEEIIELMQFFRECIARYERDEDDELNLDRTLENLNFKFALGRQSVFLNEPFGDAYCRFVLLRDRQNRIKGQARFIELFDDLRANLINGLNEEVAQNEENMAMINSVEPSQTQGRALRQKYPPFILKEVSRSVLRVLHQTLSKNQPGMSCFYCAAEIFEANPREDMFHTIIFPASHYIFLMQLCVPTIKAHFFYESIRVIKILFQYKFSQPFGFKLWSSVHNDIFESKELRQEVTPYCVELLGYFCRLWTMSDAEEQTRMISYFRKYVSTIVELLNRRDLANKEKEIESKKSADIVFILKCLPREVWGHIKYRWHFMDLDLVEYPSYVEYAFLAPSYKSKIGQLMRHTEYYCSQLPGTLKIIHFE